MAMLYLDTSDHLTLGIVDQQFYWIDHIEFADKKNAGKLHATIQTMCQKHSLELTELQGVISIAGPGSYTGMRLAEGLAQVLEWQKIPKFSFYHYDIPLMANITSGVFIANAFKSEWWVRIWDADTHQDILIPESEMEERLIHFKFKQIYLAEIGDVPQRSWGQALLADGHQLISTAVMIKDRPEHFLKQVVAQKMSRDLFYYRPVEKEFRTSS